MNNSNENVIDTLTELHQLEVDANNAYEEAIKRFRDPEIKTTFLDFKQDHENHLDEIETLLAAMNTPVPKRSKDFKGFLIESMTILRSSISDEQALKAMKQNEETVYDKYEKCLEKIGFQNSEVKLMIQSALNDESKHYDYILSKLNVPPDSRMKSKSRSAKANQEVSPYSSPSSFL